MVVKPLHIFIPVYSLISTRFGPALLTCNKNCLLHHVYDMELVFSPIDFLILTNIQLIGACGWVGGPWRSDAWSAAPNWEAENQHQAELVPWCAQKQVGWGKWLHLTSAHIAPVYLSVHKDKYMPAHTGTHYAYTQRQTDTNTHNHHLIKSHGGSKSWGWKRVLLVQTKWYRTLAFLIWGRKCRNGVQKVL